MKVFGLVLLAISATTVSARTSLNVPTVNVQYLQRHLGASVNIELTTEQIISLYEQSFLGRCLEAYGLNEYVICELQRIPENYTAYMELLSENDASLAPDMGAVRMENITEHYNVSDMTVDTCTEAFVGYDALQCVFYLSTETLQAFGLGLQANFSGVDECSDLAEFMAASMDGESGLNMTEACAEQSMQDESMGSSTRRFLQETGEDGEDEDLYDGESDEKSSADDSTGLTEEDMVSAELEEFFAIADKCDEVAPNTVTRPPSSASLALPSLAAVVALLSLFLF
ncbi:Hypothetical Protein FCC1311_002512 [Hondaea fermentalgiana]|uniref:Uncharacterized protein n=1 Tax=Hondaea fermentalgiana TaxID=2315210 RepID=A0A2R5G6G4_9STRA|nr:Hypothetical Protein FCC1311_002512 [Hondaea fermentalgiana]|eukprot:GBG24033.1 Hypothetical Protein FCC1311_002512 [Hondaea fermentalgiana]